MIYKCITVIVGLLIINFSNQNHLKTCDKSNERFIFPEKFNALKVKNRLKIIRIKKNDDFSYNLVNCKPEFYKGVIDVQEYYLESQDLFNKIGVVEYVFNDSVTAENALRIGYQYAEFTRKLDRDHYDERCSDSWLTQIYYASRNGSHLFLYTMYYNFKFTQKEFNVDAIIRSNKQILLSELYGEMTNRR